MSREENIYQDDEVTLKDLILKLKEYAQEVFRNIFLVIIICLITTSYFLYEHFTFIPQYRSELRFVVEGQNGVSGGLGGLLGSIGIKRGGAINSYKILEVGKSNVLFNNLIYSKMDGDTIVANKILKEYGLLEQWVESDKKFKEFYFKKEDSAIERLGLKKLKTIVWGSPKNKSKALSEFWLDDEKGIYNISTESTSESLSLAITTKLFENIKSFFEDEVFENQKRSAEILAVKADSLKDLRTSKIYQLARFEDRNKGLLLKENETQRAVLTQEIQALSMAYAEILKNYEMTDINLKDLQPLFMEIDRPFSPIQPTSSSLLKNLIKGLLIGAILGILLIVGRKTFKDIMK